MRYSYTNGNPKAVWTYIALGLTVALGSALTLVGQGRASKKMPPRTLVTVTMTDEGARSELPWIPIGGPVGLRDARFSAMYFGQQSDADLSFLILAKFQRLRYSGKRTFAVKFVIDDVPLGLNLRMVNRVAVDERGESLQFSVTTDELAWMCLGEKLEIIVYEADSQQRIDAYQFTAAGLRELKSFAKSVLVLRKYEL